MPIRRMMVLAMVLVVGLLCLQCTRSEPKQAENSLQDFFAYLNEGEFEKAAALYGGEYDVLRGWNPDVEPSDYATLWERGCLVNGLQCLKIETIGAHEAASPGTFEFYVQFADPSGGVFYQESEAGTGTQSTFKFTVRQEADQYVVMDLPVYAP